MITMAPSRSHQGGAGAARGPMQVGIISDTHGLMRPEALAALAGSDLIIHAGDVGKPEVLRALEQVAPTFAVRGNVDEGPWADLLPEELDVPVGGLRFHVLHRIADLRIDPAGEGIAAVIYGHSHKPAIEWRGDVLLLNPGSAGPRRFKLPITVARVRVAGVTVKPELLSLM
jgi:putative phosphoesterase